MSPTSRRRFIHGALAASGGIGWGGGVAWGAVNAQTLQKLRTRLKGRLFVPGEAGYEAARRVFFWNPESERHPAAVVRAARADDVRYAVEFARKQGLELAVKGGGHSPLGWGTSNGVVIDMTGMNGVTIDPAKRVARVDGGVLGGEIMRMAGRHGLAPIVGQCPGVGATGVTLGGGLGWLAGLHGASCDHLLAARMVTADGRVVVVDGEREPELLWGLKGAGANFGVTTGFDCRLFPVGPVTAGDIFYPVREARTVVRFFRDFMHEAPDSFQASLNLTPGARGVFISFCHAGASAEGERLVGAMRKAATPAKEAVKLQAFAELAERSPVAAAGVNFRCNTTVYRDEYSDDLIDHTLDLLAQAPPETVIGHSHYMHGAVCRVAAEAAAYPLRQAGAVHVRIGMDWNDAAASQRLMAWAEEARQKLRPESGERIYANYQSSAGEGSSLAVFGANHARVAALKSKYDPANFFRRNSNVEPGKA